MKVDLPVDAYECDPASSVLLLSELLGDENSLDAELAIDAVGTVSQALLLVTKSRDNDF